MSKAKKIGIIAALVLIIALGVGIWYYLTTWPLRFGGALDDFFGKGNWQWVSSESKESRIYSVYYTSRSNPALSGERPGTFHEWEIAFENRAGEQELWSITDHTMKINHDKYWLLSPNRYSARQALTLELMEVSFAVVEQEISDEVLSAVLTPEQVECVDVILSYHGGNPPPEFYDELRQQPWFRADQVTAQDYLQSDLYDFYVWIRVYDYRAEQLPAEQQQSLKDSLDDVVQALQDAYGSDVGYEVYLGEGYRAEG